MFQEEVSAHFLLGYNLRERESILLPEHGVEVLPLNLTDPT